jgi:hypothetical protein
MRYGRCTPWRLGEISGSERGKSQSRANDRLFVICGNLGKYKSKEWSKRTRTDRVKAVACENSFMQSRHRCVRECGAAQVAVLREQEQRRVR